jgi:hypothetical protein
MSKKTIAKIFAFVILSPFVTAVISSCSNVSLPGHNASAAPSHYEKAKIVGTIKNSDITESSGLAASKCQDNVLWTHNDSDDDPFIFAVNKSGDTLGTWKVKNAENLDWEDIAAFKDKSGQCFLYIGEIGDNKLKRAKQAVYRVKEPKISPEDAYSSGKKPLETESAEISRFEYPDQIQNAETLMVHPTTGDVYVITKRIVGAAAVFRFRPSFGTSDVAKLEKVADISVPAIPSGVLTGGDISPDGRHVVICDYSEAYEFTLPEAGTNFDDVWKQAPEAINLGKRKQGESICYSTDGNAILAGSEGRNSPIIEVKRK